MARDEYGLTPKQRAFADEYIRNKGNATDAMLVAGYSERYARNNAPKQLQNTTIRDYIKDMTEDALKQRKYDAQELIVASWGISMGEVQKGYSKQYDHLKKEVIKETSYEFTPTIEEKQRSIEFLSKLLKLDESDKLKDRLTQAQIDKIHNDIVKDESAEDKVSGYLNVLTEALKD